MEIFFTIEFNLLKKKKQTQNQTINMANLIYAVEPITQIQHWDNEK